MNKLSKLTKWTVPLLLIGLPLSVAIAQSNFDKKIVPILQFLLFDDEDEITALKPLNDTGIDWGGVSFW